MAQFIMTYHGKKKPEITEEDAKNMAKWQAWATGMGDALINPGTPVGITKVITKDGISAQPSPHPIMGFSIIEAADMEAALQLTQSCPHLDYAEGTLELSEMMKMPE